MPGYVVLSQQDGNSWLRLDPTTGMLMTALRRGSYTPTLASEFVITDGVWHHIGVVWDGAHRHLYADGTRVAEDTSDVGYLRPSNGTLCMGVGHALEAASFFSGLIDEVRIYDVALSTERIEALAR